MELRMDKAFTITLMEMCMKGNGWTIICKEEVLLHMLVGISTRENGLITAWKERGSICIRGETNMRGSTTKTTNKDMECIISRTEMCMKGTG